MADPSALSPEPPTPVSPQEALVCSTFPLPKPRDSGCKTNFACFVPLRASLHPYLSLLGRNPTAFHRWMLFEFLFWCYRLGSPAWCLDFTLLRGNIPNCWTIPLELQFLPVRAQPALLHLFTSYQSSRGAVVSSVKS